MVTAQHPTSVFQALHQRIPEARQQTDRLFEIVRPEVLYDRPIPERHRIIFYLGHLEAFDWNLLNHRLFDLDSFSPEFDRLFAFGIDPVGGGLPSDQSSDWPSLEKVHDYVCRMREKLDSNLEMGEFTTAGPDSDPETLLNVAVEHRLMHAETLAYMLHQLPLASKICPPHIPPLKTQSPANEMIRIPEGIATLGLSRSSGIFGWDNEFEAQQIKVPAFAIDKYMVTNREFLEFVNAGGYKTRSLWSEADWQWKAANAISHPVFWKGVNGEWYYRTMFDEILLPLDWSVYVSHAEASAYARWARKGLPSEAQWHRAAYGTPRGTEDEYPWGDAPPDHARGNFDFKQWDPAPVNAFPAGDSGFGVSGLIGNGWEWTSTLLGPFSGFERFSFYPGYSADFFDGKHYVMKGGSARTAASMLRRSFRNWFQPRYQYVYAGFRCVSA